MAEPGFLEAPRAQGLTLTLVIRLTSTAIVLLSRITQATACLPSAHLPKT